MSLRDFFPRSHRQKLSFGEVVSTEIPVLYRVARRLVLNEADAEDLVGQTLLLGAKGWASFDGRYARSWLIRILRNEHLGRIRHRAIRPESALAEVAEPSDDGFWKEVSWRAVGEDILRELDRLPEEYRIAVALCDIEELSYEEAADAIDVPVGTIRSRLFRGRRLLRSRLVRAVGHDFAEPNLAAAGDNS
ncbi:RNA polymerase sigma factor [Fimbriimonas ginsengisoli]|nr:sigma-70 family RNA polymerase sigma factor [Fimbriimonas ginsengisoli]